MRSSAILATLVLLTGSLAAAPAHTGSISTASPSAEARIAGLLTDPSVDILDEREATDELMDAGFNTANVSEVGAEVSAELTSTLGGGAEVSTDLTVDFASGQGQATVESADPGVGSQEFIFHVHELTDSSLSVTVTDPRTGETEHVATSTGSGAAIPLILGIPLLVSALEALLAASAVVIVAGVTYVAVTNAIQALNRDGSSYQHFIAMRLANRPLMIGGGISFGTAVKIVSGGGDIWSRSQGGAKTVCQSAGGGRPPVGPEKDASGSFKVWHYHTVARNGAHCFYGS